VTLVRLGGTPRCQPTPGSSNGQRVSSSLRCRSSRAARGISIRNGCMVCS